VKKNVVGERRSKEKGCEMRGSVEREEGREGA